MKFLSQQKALERLAGLKTEFKEEIARTFEHRAKSCLTCETQGDCCLDAHFVNVHISRLEAVAINNALNDLSADERGPIYARIRESIEHYGLESGDSEFSKTYACPMFEKGVGCIIHNIGKPVPCIAHACYENHKDLPPDELQHRQEQLIDDLNFRTFGRPQPDLPLPVALARYRR